MEIEYAYAITDRETREVITAVPADAPCRLLYRFREGAITRAEWKAAPVTTVAQAAKGGWPVAMEHGGGRWLYARAFDIERELSPAYIAHLEAVRCKHPRVTRGRCSDGCKRSKAVVTPHHREPDGIPFLMGSCRFCHAVLINICDDCKACVL